MSRVRECAEGEKEIVKKFTRKLPDGKTRRAWAITKIDAVVHGYDIGLMTEDEAACDITEIVFYALNVNFVFR